MAEIGTRSNLTYTICDVADFCKTPPQGVAMKFDEIYHLASVVGPAGVLAHAGKIVKQIISDLYYLIELALNCGRAFSGCLDQRSLRRGAGGLLLGNDVENNNAEDLRAIGIMLWENSRGKSR